MKILLVMEKRVNAGSIQAVANYVRAGDELGHTIAFYGPPDPAFPGLRFSLDVRAFDYAVFIFESKGWMSELQLAHLLSAFPRSRRVILDADGMYNPTVVADGHDRNHAGEQDRLGWRTLYEALGDKILQPTYEPREPNVLAVPFYGYDPGAQVRGADAPAKRYDILYVGHNWWRWHQVSTVLLPAIAGIRDRVGDIAFVGNWWDAVPPWAGWLKLEEAFCLEPERFRRLRVEVRPAVPYDRVIPTMSTGRVNVMTQRPLLRQLNHLTSKYFEIFCADTSPLIMLPPEQLERVYGPAGRELALHDDVAGKLLDALHRPHRYREAVEEVRRHLGRHHSYRRRVQELVAALEA